MKKPDQFRKDTSGRATEYVLVMVAMAMLVSTLPKSSVKTAFETMFQGKFESGSEKIKNLMK